MAIDSKVQMPPPIMRSVQMQNIKFMHTKNQFSVEYFNFIKRLLHNNGQVVFAHHQKREGSLTKGKCYFRLHFWWRFRQKQLLSSDG